MEVGLGFRWSKLKQERNSYLITGCRAISDAILSHNLDVHRDAPVKDIVSINQLTGAPANVLDAGIQPHCERGHRY